MADFGSTSTSFGAVNANVRDVLAPLFCNGKSFSALIDELCRHFKIEGGLQDTNVSVLEASSESQSTDSEAEGNISDEASAQLVEARAQAQARSKRHSSGTTNPAVIGGDCILSSQLSLDAPVIDDGKRNRGRASDMRVEGEEGGIHRAQLETTNAGRKEAEMRVSPKETINRNSARVHIGSSRNVSTRAQTGLGDTRRIGNETNSSVSSADPTQTSTTRQGRINCDNLTVLAVTANADGWSEAVGAALATRARAGCVFAQEVDVDKPTSNEFVREEFQDERSGAHKALEVRTKLIPKEKKVLLCSAWVDSGEYLCAAVKLVMKCQAKIFGIACVRFEHNSSTHSLIERFNLFAKSMPKGTVPSLNVGMKSCIPASLTKGFHWYISRGGQGGATWPGDRAGGAAFARCGYQKKWNQQNTALLGSDAGGTASLQGSTRALINGGTGGSGQREGSGDSGGGGTELGRREEEEELECKDGGYCSEEGDYAADSERSTENESMHFSGGGRESDEHEGWEKDQGSCFCRRRAASSWGVKEREGEDREEDRGGRRGVNWQIEGRQDQRKDNVDQNRLREWKRRGEECERGGGQGRKETGISRGSNDRMACKVRKGGKCGSEIYLLGNGTQGGNKRKSWESDPERGSGAHEGEGHSDGNRRAWSTRRAVNQRLSGKQCSSPLSVHETSEGHEQGSSGSSFISSSPRSLRHQEEGTFKGHKNNPKSDGDKKVSGCLSAAVAAVRPQVPWHHTSLYEANNPGEDRHVAVFSKDLGVHVYCVCDGHGGSRAAQFTCDHLVGEVLERLGMVICVGGITEGESRLRTGTRASTAAATAAATAAVSQDGRVQVGLSDAVDAVEGDIRSLLVDSFLECDRSFIAQLDPKKNKGYINAGCCVVVALLIRSKLYVAHVGDCRAVLGTSDATRLKYSGGGIRSGGPAVGTTGEVAATFKNDGGSSNSNIAIYAVPLTRDHNCDDKDEVAIVEARSGDENAVRVSRNDEWKGATAIKRVAGSLAVTRAIGDAYLKEASFSFTPYKERVPYITAEPEVNCFNLNAADEFLVLATDGVWEQATNEEVVHWVAGALNALSVEGGKTEESAAPITESGLEVGSPRTRSSKKSAQRAATSATSDAVVNQILMRSAKAHGMSLPTLKQLPLGSSRRVLHDDICATVIRLPAPPPPQYA